MNRRKPFAMIADHVLLPFADGIEAIDARMTAAMSPAVIARVVAMIPDDWLVDDPLFAGPDARNLQRKAYADDLESRLQAPRAFADEAVRARRARDDLHV